MRQQLGILKEKIDGQALVSDRLIRQSMLSKMSFMKKYTWVSFLLLAFIYIVFYQMRVDFHLSWWLYGFTLLITTFDVCLDAYINRFSESEFLSGNLLATSQRMLWMKRLRKRGLILGICQMAIWMPWLITEFYQGTDADAGGENEIMFYAIAIGGCAGMAIGAGIGLWIYFRMQRINSDIISQIAELTNGEEKTPA